LIDKDNNCVLFVVVIVIVFKLFALIFAFIVFVILTILISRFIAIVRFVDANLLLDKVQIEILFFILLENIIVLIVEIVVKIYLRNFATIIAIFNI